MTDQRLAELHELLGEPDELASSVMSPLTAEGAGQELVVGLCASTREVYRGICVLLERGLAEEARMLWRTLLDDTALLMWLVVHRDELEDLALRYHYTAATRSELIARAAGDAGFGWAAEMEAERVAQLSEIEGAAAERGLTLKQLPNTRQLLQELRQHERLYY